MSTLRCFLRCSTQDIQRALSPKVHQNNLSRPKAQCALRCLHRTTPMAKFELPTPNLLCIVWTLWWAPKLNVSSQNYQRQLPPATSSDLTRELRWVEKLNFSSSSHPLCKHANSKLQQHLSIELHFQKFFKNIFSCFLTTSLGLMHMQLMSSPSGAR